MSRALPLLALFNFVYVATCGARVTPESFTNSTKYVSDIRQPAHAFWHAENLWLNFDQIDVKQNM